MIETRHQHRKGDETMANTQLNDTKNAKIQGILARYLELRSNGPANSELSGHLDEDTLNAFTEGMINEREALPVVQHLGDCSFCRHRTVELVRLEMFFAEQDEPVAVRETASEPVSVSSVLSGILSRIFGSNDAAVFAHEEKKSEDDQADESKSEKSDEQAD
jgi:hypothetical protein